MSNVAATGNLAAIAISEPRTVRFGVFEVDLRSGELRRGGVRVPIQDQPFRVLVYLIERAGNLVSREELRDCLWPVEFVDFDHGLNTAIRKLRSALDDSADNPRFIETLSRRGYRFIAPVGRDDAPATPKAESATARERLAFWGIGAILLAALVGVLLAARTPAPSIVAVAILPFTNDRAASQHVSDGLTEGLINELSRLPAMRVMARTTVFRFQGKAPDPQRVGSDLDVGAVVVGDVRHEAGAYRIRVELVDVRSGSQLWGNIFRATAAELPALQARMADELAKRLSPAPVRAAVATANAEAHELYLRGLYAWNQRGKDDIREAIEHFTRAAELDPTYAAPHAGLANAWGVLVGGGVISAEEGAPRVLAAARKALELDPENAEAYTSLATTKFRNLWDFAGADEDYRKALALNPNYATAHQWYADYLRSMGRLDESRREIEIAYKLDPLSTAITTARCFRFLMDRQYREAIAFSRKAGEVDRRFASPGCVARAFSALGEFEHAFDTMEQAGSPHQEVAHLRAAYRQHGRDGLYRKRLESFLARQNSEYNFPVEIAETHAILGESDEAFRWLDIAYAHRVARLTSFHVNPSFDSLRGDPRFAALLKRIGLPVSAAESARPPSARSSVLAARSRRLED